MKSFLIIFLSLIGLSSYADRIEMKMWFYDHCAAEETSKPAFWKYVESLSDDQILILEKYLLDKGTCVSPDAKPTGNWSTG